MNVEHPIFVPYHDEHLAAVVTTPQGPARSLVVLLQGLGAPRSHKHRLWTRTARDLADRGIASVRMDYPELGDSTGAFPGDLHAPPVAEATAVARVALEATGVERYGIVGNCLGARTALSMAKELPGCVSVSVILPGSPKNLLEGDGRTAPHRAARRLSKRAPKLGSIGRRMLRSHKIKPRLRFLPEAGDALHLVDFQLLYLGKADAAERLRDGLTSFAAEVGATEHRAEVEFIPAGITTGMRLSLEEQVRVIDAVVAWMDETLPTAGDGTPKAVATAPAETGGAA